jgi:hypothetical protein
MFICILGLLKKLSIWEFSNNENMALELCGNKMALRRGPLVTGTSSGSVCVSKISNNEPSPLLECLQVHVFWQALLCQLNCYQ